MRCIAQQDPAAGAHLLGARQRQRPGARVRRSGSGCRQRRPWHRAKARSKLAASMAMSASARSIGHRPHQRIGHGRAAGDERAASASTSGERNHCRASPGMHGVGLQPCRHGALLVALHAHGHAQRSRVAEALPSANASSAACTRPVAHAPHVRRKGQRRIEHALQFGGIDDPGQGLDALRPGGELQHTGAGIALDVHVVHRAAGIVGQGRPTPSVRATAPRSWHSTQRRARRRAPRAGAGPPAAASCSATDRPCRDRASARHAPTGPAPRTHTSTLLMRRL